MMSTASSGLTPQYQTYYDKQLLAHAMPLIVTAQFAQKKPFPKNKGATSIRYFRPNIADRTRVASLTEGVPLNTFQDVVYTPIDVTLSQYGEAVKITDIVSFTDLFSTLDQSTRMMGEDAGVHADFQCVQKIATGVNSANKRYAQAATSYSNLQASTSVALGKLTIKDLLGAYTRLTVTKAKKPEGQAYATILTPQQAYDVMDDAKFIDSGVRGNNKGLFNGEIGTWYGNRILVTTEGWTENSTEGTYDGTIVADTASTGTIFSALVLGREALGAPIMAGQSPFSPSIIVNDGADSGNPLKQFITAGWKAYWATVMLNDLWAVVIRSKSSYA
jgi:N4-gp56 family major capsid protein